MDTPENRLGTPNRYVKRINRIVRAALPAFIWMILWPCPVRAATSEIDQIKAGDHKGFTRIVFYGRNPFQFKEPVIIDKGRFSVVFPFTTTTLAPETAFHTTDQIKSLELIQHQSHVTANVTLRFPFFKVRPFTLTSPHRLVVDIYPMRRPSKTAQRPAVAFITHIRTGDHKDFSRVVFQAEGGVGFKKPEITGRGKFSLLLPNADASGVAHIAALTSNQIKSVQLFQQGPDVVAHVNLVLPYFKLKTYTLESPHRLVLDIYPAAIAPRELQDTVAEKVRHLTQTGDLDKALSILTPYASAPTTYPILYSDYLAILFWNGKRDEAIRRFEALPSSFSKRPYLLRNMAKAYYDNGAFLKAASVYKETLQQEPSDRVAQKGMVLSLMQANEFEQALDYVNQFLAPSIGELPLISLKAELLMKMKRYLEALAFCRVVEARRDLDSEQFLKWRDNTVADLPKQAQQTILDGLRAEVQLGKPMAELDRILVLVLTKDYAGAVRAFESAEIGLEGYSPHLLCWVARAYFKMKKTETAMKLYQRVLADDPQYLQAKIGLSYCLAAKGDSERALHILDTPLSQDPENLEIHFARAFIYEQGKDFWAAVKEYDRILEIQSTNFVAARLRLMALSDLGAHDYALEQAYITIPADTQLHNTIIGDMAVDRIRWEEPKKAIQILSPLLQKGDNLRMELDYTVALAEDNRMEEVVALYEKLVDEGVSAPPWVLEKAAEAYLELEQPHKALALYDHALRIQPHSFEGRMGKFYTLQELREWDQAEELLEELDKDTPTFTGRGNYIQPNWTKLEVALAKGWFIAYKDQLQEAEQYFSGLCHKAPAHSGIRNGLAHVYLFRGWPRMALKEFRIISTIEPDYVKAKIGKIEALNALAAKEQAREEAAHLRSLYPKDKHVQQLVRSLHVEEMRELSTDVAVLREQDGTEEIRFETEVSQPVSLYSTIYGFILWQRSRDDFQSSKFERAGLGFAHIFDSSWDMRQQFSVSYRDGDDFGSFTLINFHPDDYLNMSASYDSFSTDVPLRARVFGIEAERAQWGITYRESEWRSYYLSLARQIFSDHNDRDQALLGYEQGLWVGPDWKMRLYVEGYASRNSRDDAPYFNPERDLSLSATHMIEQTVWRIYNRAFMHRLFLTAGVYKQKGFSGAFIGGMRYEQEHEFSDTQTLLWGADLFRNVYDGEDVGSFAFDLNYRLRF